MHLCTLFGSYTVEPHYNEVLGTMNITLLYQVSHYIRVKKLKYKELGPAKLPCYNEVPLYHSTVDIFVYFYLIHYCYTVRPRKNRTLKQRDAATKFRGV